MSDALSSILWMKQLAIRLGYKQPQPSRWLPRKRAREQMNRCASFTLTALFHVKQEALFSDAEAAENLAEQIVRGELPGNFVQRALREAQLFGEQFRARQHRPCPDKVGLR